MTDSRHSEHHAPERAPIDSEIDVRRAVEVGLWLGGTTIGALVIDTWFSMGDKEGKHRHNILKPYQVNALVEYSKSIS